MPSIVRILIHVLRKDFLFCSDYPIQRVELSGKQDGSPRRVNKIVFFMVNIAATVSLRG